MPRIVSRSEWGARHDNGAGPAPLPAEEVWLHHTVTTPTADGAADVRGVEAIGESRFGRGISYTFLVHPSGAIYEGHGVDRVGTHTAGRNTRARAICLVGNYELLVPTEEQVDAIAWLLAHGAREGWWRHARLAGGHRDLKQTACPGDHAYAAIPEINRRAAGGPAEEDDMALSKEVEERFDRLDEKVSKVYNQLNRKTGKIQNTLLAARGSILRAIGKPAKVEVDTDEIVEAILDAGVGEAVADALAKRLRD